MTAITIEIRIVCTRCEEAGWKSDHRTTAEECARLLGRPCDWPEEHHPRKRRRIRVKVIAR